MTLHQFKCKKCDTVHTLFTDELMTYKSECCDSPELEITDKEVSVMGCSSHPATMHRQYDSLQSRRKWVKEDGKRASDELDDKGFHQSVKDR